MKYFLVIFFILFLATAVFGFTAVFLQSFGKLIALIILFCLMLALAISVVIFYKRQHPHIPGNTSCFIGIGRSSRARSGADRAGV